jgi:hypothetical protein
MHNLHSRQVRKLHDLGGVKCREVGVGYDPEVRGDRQGEGGRSGCSEGMVRMVRRGGRGREGVEEGEGRRGREEWGGRERTGEEGIEREREGVGRG